MMQETLTRSALEQLRAKLNHWLEFDPDHGVHRLDREVFLNEEIFELEMRHLFEGGWVYVAHESQLPNENDFFVSHIGRQSVIVTRDRQGQLSCVVNACSHRGARLARVKTGNRKSFTCSFHGWVYDARGRCLDVRDQACGGYLPGFDKQKMDLPKAKVESYGGFIFASLNPDVIPLDQHLGHAKEFIDLILDQSPTRKFEVIPGAVTYTYNGNWKIASENGTDGYHGPMVHASYISMAARRMAAGGDRQILDLSKVENDDGGFFYFGQGHVALWSTYPNAQVRPNYGMRDDYIKKYGEHKAQWMIERSRNLNLYPNVFLMDTSSNQIRIIRPISVNKTEVTAYCIGPVGESPESRARRIRQYEDFFNPSGLATPDDMAEFNNCQIGFGFRSSQWNDLSRGAARCETHPDGNAGDGVQALQSGRNCTNEGIFISTHKDWQDKMNAAIDLEIEKARS